MDCKECGLANYFVAMNNEALRVCLSVAKVREGTLHRETWWGLFYGTERKGTE